MNSKELMLRDELASLRAALGKSELERSDLEIELQAAIEHGDAIEAELALANEQMRAEIAERIRAEAKLQRLLTALSEQKTDLELLVHTITQHSDEIDIEQETANEQLRLENERIRLAKEQAESLAQAKADFVAVVSHEVRTPMNGLLGMTRLLLDTPLTREQRDIAGTVLSSGRLLLSILDELLDLSKIEAGKLQIEQLDVQLVDLVEDCFELMGPQAAERGLIVAQSIAAEVPAVVRGDPSRLRQVLLNLIGNAVKFTEKGSVTLRVRRQGGPDGGEWLSFALTDTGIGIAEEARQSLFSRYVQAAAWVARKFGGTGLGLSICRQLVELMGGEIGVDSTPGKGSTFWFRLPLVSAAEPGERIRPNRRPGRVLLLGPDDAARLPLEETLAGWGMEVVTAPVDQAESLCRGGDLAVVSGGMEFAMGERLQSLGLPVIALVPMGGGLAGEERRGMVVLTQPVREAALARAMDRLLSTDAFASAPSSGERGGGNAPVASAGTALAILVVEDNPVNRRVASGFLARQGHRVLLAENGAQALEVIAGQPVDLILMDRHMPVMDGLQTIRAIRALPPPAGTLPVVALTAAATPEEVRECLAAGMNDFIPKPFTPEQLIEVIGRQVGKHDVSEIDSTVLATLRDMLGMETMGETIGEYLVVAERLLAHMKRAVALRDGRELAEIAHDLRGCSLHLGLTGMGRLCAEIETALQAGRLDESFVVAGQVPAAFARARVLLREA